MHAPSPPLPRPLLQVQQLSLRGPRGAVILDRLSFEVGAGEVVALVGESGSGKTLTARALLRLLPPQVERSGGAIRFDGLDLDSIPEAGMRQLRGASLGMVFQDPAMSLNPAMKIGRQLCEGLRQRGHASADAARSEAIEMLERVRIARAGACLEAYPHQFSEGVRQRIMIASVMLRRPRLLIADEPTSALDALTRRDTLEVLIELTRSANTALLLISHDLGLVARCASAVVVLRQGQLIEAGDTQRTLRSPRESYTRNLIDALPRRADARPALPTAPALIEAREISVTFRSGGWLSPPIETQAVDRVTLAVQPGETLALVGASGSGKSTLGRALIGLVPLSGGTTHFHGTALATATAVERRAFRLACQIVFQDPYSSLDPRQRVGDIVAEPLRHGAALDSKARLRCALAMLEEVDLGGLEARFPHELSAGQRQRVAIARALVRKPEFIVADEPLSTLDMMTQRHLLRLFETLQARHGFACIFITHSLVAVSGFAHRVAVMNEGRIVEQGSVETLYDHPRDEYTRRLIEASALPASNRHQGSMDAGGEWAHPACSLVTEGPGWRSSSAAWSIRSQD